VAGLATAFGSGAMTNSIGEIEHAEVLLVIGSNTTENHPVIGAAIRRAVLHHGAKLIVADPREIGLTQDAALWLRQRPGTDLALINGLIQVILENGWQNQEYIDQHTENFEALAQTVKSYPPQRVAEITGVPAEKIVEAARLYAQAGRAGIYYAMGITQHHNGTDNVKALANLALVCGHLGKPSSGVNPLRGQNNVQGACDLGALPGDLTGYQKVADLLSRQRFAQAWGVDSLPDTPGLTVTEMMDAALAGSLKAMLIMGENPALSDPDSNHVRQALRRMDLLVVMDIFLTETAQLADVVLPTACWAEKDGTFTNTERRVQRVRKAVPPPGQAKPDWWVLTELGKRLGQDWNYRTPQQIFEELRRLTPSYAGITYRRLERLGGLQWPCPDTRHPGTPILHVGGCARGKGLFSPVEHQEPAEPIDSDYPLVLTTGRLLYHYHTGSMTRRVEGLNQLAAQCLVEINPADARELGVSDGARVQVSSRRGEVTAQAWVTDRVPAGVVFMPFHFAESAANLLTNKALDPDCKIPELKVCAVRLKAA